MTVNRYSYRELYDQACIELQGDAKKELVELLQSWRKEDIDTLTQLEKQENRPMPATQDFLNNAKIYIDHIDGNCLWLVDFKNEIATTWGLSSFVEKDFDRIGTPTKERYEDFLELLKRETPLVSSWMRVAPTPVTLSSAAILQRLSIATPILASLAQADYYIGTRFGNPAPHDALVSISLRLADTLLSEVQK